ncbi:hypothetical protein SALBM217S_08572 [Streptomyces griseoloalbus]
MTTASSASWCTSREKEGYWISSPGPMTEVAGLKKANGASGTSLPTPRVLGVVAAEGHHLVGEHRGQQPDLAQRDLRAGELEVRERDALDDVQDELVLPVALDRAKATFPSMENLAMRTGCLAP